MQRCVLTVGKTDHERCRGSFHRDVYDEAAHACHMAIVHVTNKRKRLTSPSTTLLAGFQGSVSDTLHPVSELGDDSDGQGRQNDRPQRHKLSAS